MRKIHLFSLLIVMALAFMTIQTQEAKAQGIVIKDSSVYLDSSKTHIVSGYDEYYIDFYNRSDSTNVMNIYDVNFLGVNQPVYVHSLADGYNWTAVSNITLTAGAKASYKIHGVPRELMIQYTTMETKINRVDFVIKGINTVRR